MCRKLAEIRKREPKGTIAKMREASGISGGSWYAYRCGDRRPSAEVRAVLQTLLGIDPMLWLSADERKAVRARERALKRAAA